MVLEAAKAWVSLEPDSAQARNTFAAVLVSQGPLSESKPFLARWIADSADKPEVFRNLNRVLGSQKNRRDVFDVVREVAAPYDIFEAHLAIVQSALAVDAKDKTVLDPALAAWPRAAIEDRHRPGRDQSRACCCA